VQHKTPVLLFLGLVGDPAIFDLHPGNSWVERLLADGFDVYLFDWGSPEAAESGHTLETYLDDYFMPALDAARRINGSSDVSLGAYCMGALMALLLLGSTADVPVRNLVLFAPPCDYSHAPGFLRSFQEGRLSAEDAVDRTTGLVPASAMRTMFRLLQPTADVVQLVTLWENLWRAEYVAAHRAVNHWAWNHRAMAGPAFIETVTSYVQSNALVNGTARLGVRPVHLSSVKVPTLIVVATRDEFVPPENSGALVDLLGSQDVEVLEVPGGHAGALMGSGARKVAMPGVVSWLERHDDA
jgi:polyhydroxyalkanoate synthase